jgi:hypothetical protein
MTSLTEASTVVGVGWHDTCVRWDISTPQAAVARLEALPGQGTLKRPGKKLFAERDRFGKWQHLLGSQHVLLSYTVDSPQYGVIRRLELQAHLGDAGEDDLCAVADFSERFRNVQTHMAFIGVLPAEEPVYVRVDPAVDVAYDDPREAFSILEGLRFARWPYGWYAEWQGPPPYTTVAIKSRSKTVARVYCRNTKLRNGEARWGKLRFEREQRFEWKDQRPVTELQTEATASAFWGSVFGLGSVSGTVTRVRREEQTMKLIERVELGEITTSQYEQLTGFLDAERLGLTDRVYTTETARRRRTLAKSLGISASDAETEALDVGLDDLLAVPRTGWATQAEQPGPAAGPPLGGGAGAGGRGRRTEIAVSLHRPVDEDLAVDWRARQGVL